MALKLGDSKLFPYLGDNRPINIYSGSYKVTGWRWDEQSGEVLHFNDTYNDFVNVEIGGKSVQNGEPTPDYPIEIDSLNDFDVVSSVGKRNLLPLESAWTNPDKEVIQTYRGYLLDLDPTKTYRITTKTKKGKESIDGLYLFILSGTSNPNDRDQIVGSSRPVSDGSVIEEVTYTPGSNATHDTPFYISYHPRVLDADVIKETYEIFMEEKSDYPENNWTPAPEDITEDDNHPLIDKINLLLSEPLRSVGDVKDRLFKDSDGLWKIERNVGEEVFEDGDLWANNSWYPRDDSAVYGISSTNGERFKESGESKFSHVPTGVGNSFDENWGWLQANPRVRIRLDHEVIGASEPSSSAFKDWIVNEYNNGTPLTMIYELNEPTIETLDQDLQDKLNNIISFPNETYVYTTSDINPNLIGKIKVKDI